MNVDYDKYRLFKFVMLSEKLLEEKIFFNPDRY